MVAGFSRSCCVSLFVLGRVVPNLVLGDPKNGKKSFSSTTFRVAGTKIGGAMVLKFPILGELKNVDGSYPFSKVRDLRLSERGRGTN